MEEKLNGTEQESESKKIPSTVVLIGIGILLIIAAVLFYPQARRQMQLQQIRATQQAAPSLVPANPSPTPLATPLPPPPAAAAAPEIAAHPSQFGTLVLSLREGTDTHLFAYQPFLEDRSGNGFSGLPLTRLTSGSQQDITPDVSPDGRSIAFSSNRNGHWDIYILDLLRGELEQFTDTAAYDANPSWSPDGKWLVYESYQIDNLEILIQDRDRTTGPIPLTINPAADFAPEWSPQGRLISFISSRSGQMEIWYADLDSPENDKAVLLDSQPAWQVKHPTWSADGRYLTWSVLTRDGNHNLMTWDAQQPDRDPVYSGTGDWPQWAGAGEILYTIVDEPAASYLTASAGIEPDGGLLLPGVKLPGRVEGFSWTGVSDFSWSTDLSREPAPTPLWAPAGQSSSSPGEAQIDLIELRDIDAPYPQFNPEAANSFTTLRSAVTRRAGWDFLSTLENAYLPLGQPHSPGTNLDWLYTGRGLMVNDLPRLADWLVLAREDFGNQVYWRVYIRANNQGGSQGQPLNTFTWDLDARYSGGNADYENGGALSRAVPSGYWVDFTELAEAHGWLRFPAETYWQFAEQASRYLYFAFRQGLRLPEALRELYPDNLISTIITAAAP